MTRGDHAHEPDGTGAGAHGHDHAAHEHDHRGPEDRCVAVSRIIDAPAAAIFAIVDDPSMHPVIDGSGSVRASQLSSCHLRLGDKFRMDMKLGVPYGISNVVVEHEPDRLIAWRHIGGHRWRYRLAPIDGGTEVTEEFDWSTSRVPWFIELTGSPRKHPAAMRRTLDRLADVVTGRAG